MRSLNIKFIFLLYLSSLFHDTTNHIKKEKKESQKNWWWISVSQCVLNKYLITCGQALLTVNIVNGLFMYCCFYDLTLFLFLRPFSSSLLFNFISKFFFCLFFNIEFLYVFLRLLVLFYVYVQTTQCSHTAPSNKSLFFYTL